MTDRIATVSVFGSNASESGAAGDALAEAVGRQLARLGYAVANGGYGGTMEAGSRGASQAGGHVVGVTCTLWRSKPNRYVSEIIETTCLADRVQKLTEIATGGFVVLPGGTGTLLELAWVWEAMAKKFLPPRPIVCMGKFWQPLVASIAAVRSAHAELVGFAESADELGQFFPPVGR